MTEPFRLLVVSGLSGSGKSTALASLEDSGFFCVDNLPPPLLVPLLGLCGRLPADVPGLAVGMDARESAFLQDVEKALADAREHGHVAEVLFLVAANEALQRRFHETRRRHPLATDGGSTAEGIERERELLHALRDRADRVIDSTHYTVHDLRRTIRNLFGAPAPVSLRLTSFGFKYGLPRDANLVMDVRFLPNPFFDETLRSLDGREVAVSNYALANESGEVFLERLERLLDFLLPQYQAEGKLAVTVAIGCTGGKHRSVAVVERLKKHLHSTECPVSIEHRDLDRHG